MKDTIYRQAAIDAFTDEIQVTGRANAESVKAYVKFVVDRIKRLPSAQPDFSCDGCKTPKHICGICMRNYPNITDHYCTGEWAERREE